MLNEIPLKGCTPDPLMNYLKALGILRLVSEQKDPKAKGRWLNGVFYLTTYLEKDELISFFVDDYRPSPAFSPWNGDGGFITDVGKSQEIISEFRKSTDQRLTCLKTVIDRIDNMPLLKGFKDAREKSKALTKKKNLCKKNKEIFPEEDADVLKKNNMLVARIKDDILSGARAEFPDEILKWIDSSFVFLEDGPVYSPLLGSGGCDGRLEFSITYLSNILDFFKVNADERKVKAKKSMFNESIVKLSKTAVGQFSPGQIGGPNATQGMEGDSYVNSIDFILMIEGLLLFSGSSNRKYEYSPAKKGVFPFTTYSNPVGISMDSLSDAADARGETWLPFWDKKASIQEIAHLISEGRAENHRKQASSTTNMAQAIVSYGVDRGISEFFRYGYLKRNGKAYLATALGSISAKPKAYIGLLQSSSFWIERYRRKGNDPKRPQRIQTSIRNIDQAIMTYCQYGGAKCFSDILCSLGKAEKELSLTKGKIGNGDEFPLKPLTGLSSEWIQACDDGSIEFEIALTLSSIYDEKVGTLRQNLEPVKGKGWDDKDTVISWKSSRLIENMAAILERRMIDMQRLSAQDLPLKAQYYASIEAVSAFLAGDVDDQRISELLWGLCLVDKNFGKPYERREEIQFHPIPRIYCILKHLFVPEKLVFDGEEIQLKPELSVLPLLRAGRVNEAAIIAERRMRSSGLMPMIDSRFDQKNWGTVSGFGDVSGLRLAAGLLIPVNKPGLKTISKLVLRQEIKS